MTVIIVEAVVKSLRKKACKRGDIVKTMRNDQVASFVCQTAGKRDNSEFTQQDG